jgi:signal transduction histidine kinase
MGEGIAGWVAQHGEPALVREASDDPRFFERFDEQSGFVTHSVLCVPLQTRGNTIGAVEVMNKESGSFEAEDLRLLSALAASAAVAIENAQLYERAQEEIGERRRAEESLKEERAMLAVRVAERTGELRAANAELAKAIRVKDEFVSNVSHELRTPLSVLTLLGDNLVNLYDRIDEQKRHKMIHSIQKQTGILNELIDGILKSSQIDSGRISMERETVNLARLAREEVQGQELLAREKGQILRAIGAGNLPVWGNEGQLRLVIRNLLNNAIKYTPEHGEITCEYIEGEGREFDPAEWPDGGELGEGNWAALRVVDNGLGIEAEHLPHMFERFYRAETHGNVPGTGLGLSIARELVELHTGRISIFSIPKEGSIFAIYLPLLELDSKSKPESSSRVGESGEEE